MLAACLALMLFELAPFGVRLRHAAFDAYQRISPREREFNGVVVVAIDEAALRSRGQWPWPRTLMAELVDAIARAQPAAIGLDVIFAEPERTSGEGNAALARALGNRPTVLGIAGTARPDPRFPAPPRGVSIPIASERELALPAFPGHLQSLDEIDRAAAGRGLLNIEAAEPVVRRVPFVARIGNKIVPAFAVDLIRVWQTVALPRIEDRGGEEVLLHVGRLALPIQSDGFFWLHFRHRDSETVLSAEEVLSGKAAERLKGAFVLVGVTGLGLVELKASPLGEPIPGVEIHAQILEQVFDQRFLVRPAGARWLEALFLALAGIALVVFGPRMRAAWAWVLPAAMVLVLAAAAFVAFHQGWLLDAANPAIGVAAVFVAVLAATLTEAERQRKLLREAQAKVEAEMNVAQRIQMGLLPDPRKSFANEPRFRLDAFLESARTVGGDFYDCFMIDSRHLFFVVADVSGKGLSASLFMALAKSLVKSVARRASVDPGKILTRANTEIAWDNAESLFVTAFAGVLDVESGAFAYSNAGHEPPVLRRMDGTLERFEYAGGPPLCIVDDLEYPTEHRTLAPGEWLCVVTDGVTEAMNERNELYDQDRLMGVLAGVRETASPAAIVTAIRDDVRRYAGGASQSDDITVLCVRWIGPSPGPGAAAA